MSNDIQQKIVCERVMDGTVEITSDFDGVITLQFTRTTISHPKELGPLFKLSIVIVPR